MSTGVHLYIGVTGCGKTTAALADIGREIRETDGRPCLIIDSEGVETLRSIPHVRSVSAAIGEVWGRGRHAAIIPAGLDDVRALVRAASAGRRCILFVDELRYWLSAAYAHEDLQRLFRAHRHSDISVYATTQHPADIHGCAYQCSPLELRIYRQQHESALERMRREYGLDRERLRTLPRGQCITLRYGF